MSDRYPPKTNDLVIRDLAGFLQAAAKQTWPIHDDADAGPARRSLEFGDEPIQLGLVEFRIMLFLASRPYYAFTRRNIAAAVSSSRNPVFEHTVDNHIASLLEQLGPFHDYVQAVPYIGYRFKA